MVNMTVFLLMVLFYITFKNSCEVLRSMKIFYFLKDQCPISDCFAVLPGGMVFELLFPFSACNIICAMH